MPADKLELSLSVDNKPVLLRLERSNSVPAELPVITSTRNNRLTYWSHSPRSVSAFLFSFASVLRNCVAVLIGIAHSSVPLSACQSHIRATAETGFGIFSMFGRSGPHN